MSVRETRDGSTEFTVVIEDAIPDNPWMESRATASDISETVSSGRATSNECQMAEVGQTLRMLTTGSENGGLMRS